MPDSFLVELVFRQPGRPGSNRFVVKSEDGEVWFVVPVLTDYGGTGQRKLLRPVDAIELGQALVAGGVAALRGEQP